MNGRFLTLIAFLFSFFIIYIWFLAVNQIAAVTKSERKICIASFVMASLGMIWSVINWIGIAMGEMVGASGVSPPPQRISLTVFPLPVVAVVLAVYVLCAAWRRGIAGPSLFFTLPAMLMSLFMILISLTSL